VPKTDTGFIVESGGRSLEFRWDGKVGDEGIVTVLFGVPAETRQLMQLDTRCVRELASDAKLLAEATRPGHDDRTGG
jgi:hypothetical protein